MSRLRLGFALTMLLTVGMLGLSSYIFSLRSTKIWKAAACITVQGSNAALQFVACQAVRVLIYISFVIWREVMGWENGIIYRGC